MSVRYFILTSEGSCYKRSFTPALAHQLFLVVAGAHSETCSVGGNNCRALLPTLEMSVCRQSGKLGCNLNKMSLFQEFFFNVLFLVMINHRLVQGIIKNV